MKMYDMILKKKRGNELSKEELNKLIVSGLLLIKKGKYTFLSFKEDIKSITYQDVVNYLDLITKGKIV